MFPDFSPIVFKFLTVNIDMHRCSERTCLSLSVKIMCACHTCVTNPFFCSFLVVLVACCFSGYFVCCCLTALLLVRTAVKCLEFHFVMKFLSIKRLFVSS